MLPKWLVNGGAVGFRGRQTVSDRQTQLSHILHAGCHLNRYEVIADRDRYTVGSFRVDHVCGAPSRPIRPVTITVEPSMPTQLLSWRPATRR